MDMTLGMMWNRWVGSWSFNEGILFLPIDVFFFSLLFFSFFLAYITKTWIERLLFKKTIKGKLALVTGAAQGIGKEISFLLASQGVRLVLWDINELELANTQREIKEKIKGTEVHTYKCNVSSFSDVTRVSEMMQNDFLSNNNDDYVEILINNAGVVSGKSLDNLSERDVLRTMGVNTIAHFWTLKIFLPEMKKRNKGHVVTIASTCGIFSAASLSDYCASKFAVIGLHDCVRLELRKEKKFGVKMTLVCPNTTNTGMFDGIKQGFQWIFPILSPQYVARSVVDAICNNERVVYLPRSLKAGILILPSMPTFIKDTIMDFAGVSHAMDSFRGRSQPDVQQ